MRIILICKRLIYYISLLSFVIRGESVNHHQSHSSGEILSTVKRFQLLKPGRGTRANLAKKYNFMYYGGPIIANVKVVTIWWGLGVQYTSNLEQYYKAVTNSSWMNILGEYNTPNVTIGMGSWLASFNFSNAPTKGNGWGKAVSDYNIHNQLINLINMRSIPVPDKNTYYAIHFAPGITIDMGGGIFSCQVFCAYHGTMYNPSSNNTDTPYIYYGVIPDLGGKCSNVCGSGTTLNNLYSVSSHELGEAITDPGVDLDKAWYDYMEGEVFDVCNHEVGTTVGSDGVIYPVQKMWSNQAGSCIFNKELSLPTLTPVTRQPSVISIKPSHSITKQPMIGNPSQSPSLRTSTTRKPSGNRPISKRPSNRTNKPSKTPTKKPTFSKPSQRPLTTRRPSARTTKKPSKKPTRQPTLGKPSGWPTKNPSAHRTKKPTVEVSKYVSVMPSPSPTNTICSVMVSSCQASQNTMILRLSRSDVLSWSVMDLTTSLTTCSGGPYTSSSRKVYLSYCLANGKSFKIQMHDNGSVGFLKSNSTYNITIRSFDNSKRSYFTKNNGQTLAYWRAHYFNT